MSKVFGYYKDELDRTWYDSSNIKYSECIDKENELKKVKVVFKNGTQYQYSDVDVRDYLFFRDAPSQGKALNQYIKEKKYPYEKLENADIAKLDEEFEFRQNGGLFIDYKDGRLVLRNNADEELLNKEVELNDDAFETIVDIINALEIRNKVERG